MIDIIIVQYDDMNFCIDVVWFDVYWMLFMVNCQFKVDLCMIVFGKGVYYIDVEGCKIFDGLLGFWCMGFGYGCMEIVEVVSCQVVQFDYVLVFQFGYLKLFEFVNKIKELMLVGFDYVFFMGLGLEVVDMLLKLVCVYWCVKGKGMKMCLIGCEKGYYGVNFGGILVGGIGLNCKLFGQGFDVDFLLYM